MKHYFQEDATLSVSDGGSAVTGSDSNNNNQSGDTTGDVLANDTDADGDASLVVSAISGGTLETLINSFDNNTDVHVIQSDQDGFVVSEFELSHLILA